MMRFIIYIMVSNKLFSYNLLDRHMAITDGVFAIAMTILVLEIAIPTISDISSGVALKDYFINYIIPNIFIYFISFFLVFNFWETNAILFNFNKINNTVLILNMFTLATVCLIPFATGFLFEFYNYIEANLFFSSLILVISLLYILMFILLFRNNFKGYFDKKDEIRTVVQETYDSYDGNVELDKLKTHVKGLSLTLLYLLLCPLVSSIISLALAFISPLLSLLSFLLILFLRFFIRMRREHNEGIKDIKLSDDEREFIENIEKSIYGE